MSLGGGVIDVRPMTSAVEALISSLTEMQFGHVVMRQGSATILRLLLKARDALYGKAYELKTQ